MLRLRTLILALMSAVVVLGSAGVAQARPVPDSPVYCGPGYFAVGATCVKKLPAQHHASPGQWLLAALGVGVLFVIF